MEGDGIIDVRTDLFLCEKLPQPVSFGETNNILVKDVTVFILNRWEFEAGDRWKEIIEKERIPLRSLLSF
jgi:hypothetical protein